MDISVKISKEEYAAVLELRIQKIQQKADAEILSLRNELTKLFSDSSYNIITENGEIKSIPKSDSEKDKNGRSKKGAIGWKYIIDEILRSAADYLTYAQIVDEAMKLSGLDVPRRIAQKSIGSNLATFSKGANNRYKFETVNGKKTYSLNEKYPEFLNGSLLDMIDKI